MENGLSVLSRAQTAGELGPGFEFCTCTTPMLGGIRMLQLCSCLLRILPTQQSFACFFCSDSGYQERVSQHTARLCQVPCYTCIFLLHSPPISSKIKPLWQLSHACMVLADYAKIPTISFAHLTYQKSANAGHAAGSKREPLEN